MPGSKLVLMASRAPDRPALACVLSGNELVVATADPGQIAALLAAWQRIDAAFPGA